MHPYYIARLMNTLDHITGGRIAMNMDTSTRRSDYANFGMADLMGHGARYDRMKEFVDVSGCCGTAPSWTRWCATVRPARSATPPRSTTCGMRVST